MPVPPASAGRWFLRGARGVVSVPTAILLAAMVGFAGLARESGISMELAAVMTALIWALPSQVVLVGAIAAGASMGATILAITLCSVRLLPMVVALLPTLRGENTPRWQLYGLSTFVAVTAWVVAMAELPKLPREARVPWFAGFALALVVLNTLMTIIAYALIGGLPDMLAAALFFLTPLYFTCSLWGAARANLERFAFVAGFALLPAMHALDPTLDLVFAGIIGGTATWGLDRLRRRRGGL